MEPLTLQLRQDDEKTIECWDDDSDLQCHEDIQFRAASSATSVTSCSIRRSGHRDSISSRRSARSDLESNTGGDEDWQVQLLENDDYATDDAIASAQSAGIPLPANVPKSALTGGTIKRLGRKKPRKNFADDWSEDVEFPGPECTLKLKDPKERNFPEILRQINSTSTSPVKRSTPFSWDNDTSDRLHSALAGLARDDDDVADLQNVPTIKLPKPRTRQQATPVNNDTYEAENEVESLDNDFELPPEDLPLRRRVNANSSSQFPEDLDLDWFEGSIGVRLGGTARDRRSNPSSSVSIASPSLSSCLTGESEDDNLDGLVIPDQPLDLQTSLRKLQDPPTTAQPHSGCIQDGQESAEVDDFFSGIEIEGGDIFTANVSLNPNVKCKAECPENPTRRSATTIRFTNTPASPKTRIPRLSGHDRPHSTFLETVSESGAPLSNFWRSQKSRFGGHSSHSSLSSLPAPSSMSTSPTPQPAGRRLVGTRVSKDSLLAAHAPAGKQSLQSLKAKRSMPAMRGMYQNAMVSQAPFIPAGASENQSHHVTVKSYRHARSPSDVLYSRGSVSRLARLNHTGAVGNNGSSDADSETNAAKRTVTKPVRRRNFGNGTELELFDDLPTSSSTESKFVKHASGRGAPRFLRSRLSQSQNMVPQGETPQSSALVTSLKTPGSTPHFARDTNASRNAREQRIASVNMKDREANSFPSLGANRKAQSTSRVSSNSSAALRNKKRRSVVPGNKPHLIKPMGVGVQGAK
ncbi:putative cytokinesis regulator (Byr4), partial [Aspergillus ruber CBS 135680]